TNTAHAWVDDGAIVRPLGDLSVVAKTDALIFALAAQGGESHGWGVEGGVTYVKLSNESLAWIEDTATVRTGEDLEVKADYSLFGLEYGTADARGSSLGVGASLAWNIFVNDTEA